MTEERRRSQGPERKRTMWRGMLDGSCDLQSELPVVELQRGSYLNDYLTTIFPLSVFLTPLVGSPHWRLQEAC